ncbi:uncharacterized protein LOC122460028 [Dermochelys coriacea]|uniref:uncharacterized protein LOC122460028 n=1 Tax=Dermochelys coriacea TaxID=27794 RepID=UPI001CA83F6A|nr:uncharacterized protein LOC122460028 [Dermochelys coriacea]
MVFLPHMSGRVVRVLRNNTASLFYISRQGGTRSSAKICTRSLGLQHRPWNLSRSVSPSRCQEHTSRSPKQGLLLLPRVGAPPRGSRHDLPALGNSPSRFVCHQAEQEVPQILLQMGPGQGLPLRCLPSAVGRKPDVRVPSDSAHQQGLSKNQERQGAGYHDYPGVAAPGLVRDTIKLVSNPSLVPAEPTAPAVTRSQPTLAPQPCVPPLHDMDVAWLNPDVRACSEGVQKVLLESRKPLIRQTYLAKWMRFSRWAAERGISLLHSLVQSILDYLLHLRNQGLALSSIRVHLAAVSAFHLPIQGQMVFSHDVMIRFLRGLERLFIKSGPRPLSGISTWICPGSWALPLSLWTRASYLPYHGR